MTWLAFCALSGLALWQIAGSQHFHVHPEMEGIGWEYGLGLLFGPTSLLATSDW